jgi:hypothetical protein
MKSKLWLTAVLVTFLGLGQFLFCGCGKHNEIDITLGSKDKSDGLRRIDQGDGKTLATNASGSACRLLEERPETYLYLQVAPAFKKHMLITVKVIVECLAAKPGTFDIQYDGGTPDDPYTASANRAVLGGSGEWQTETFELSDARFQNRQNGGADFRLRVNCPAFHVRRVTVING